jgi:hypothetical protein
LGDQQVASDPLRVLVPEVTSIRSRMYPNLIPKSACFSLNTPCFFPPSPLQTFSGLVNLSVLSITMPIKILCIEEKISHYEQPAVGYPTFPGNVEALSIPASLLEHGFLHMYLPPPPLSRSLPTAITIPIPPPESTTTLRTTPGPTQSSKLKRRQTLAACSLCRKRKSKVCAFFVARKQIKQYDWCMSLS